MKYTQAQVKNRREVERVIDGNKVTYIRFKGVLRYSEPNPDYRERPEGEDTRTPSQRRRTVWREVSRMLEAEKVTKAQGKGQEKKDEDTEANIQRALDEYRSEMERKSEESAEAESAEAESAEAKTTVADYIRKYIDLRERVQLDGMRKLEASTALDYRKSLKRLEPGFGSVTMGEVTTKMIKSWERKQLEDGMSVYQVRKCHRLLHLVFEHAYMEEEIDANPVARVKPPTAQKREANSLTQEGMQFVTAQLEAMQPTPVVTAAYIALHCGLRCGEVCALRWADVDFQARTITVRGSIGTAAGGSYTKDTKTGKIRVVDFDSEHLADLLKARRSVMLAERDNIATDFDSLYVCGSSDGRHANPTTISRLWTALSESWGLVGTTGERINFHALRHSFVTAQLSTGASVRDVASNAGHASTQMTLDTYASALRKGQKDAAIGSGRYMRPQGEGAEVLRYHKTGTDN